MKLYSWIRNISRDGVKTVGSGKGIEFTLEYEDKGQDWICNTSDHELTLKYMLDKNGRPVIYIWGNKNYQVIDKRR